MKKFLALALVLTMSVAMLTGCGKKEDGSENGSNGNSNSGNGKYELALVTKFCNPL